MTDTDNVVEFNEAKSRYDLHVDETLAGFAHFRVDDRGRWVFDHTEIDHAFGGRGLGTVLVREALADAARRGETVVPECPFVVKFLKENDVAGLQVDWRESPAGDDTDPPAAPRG